MASLFDGVTAQFIDDNGKVRALIYSNITLMTSPLPPMPIDVIRDVSELPLTNIKAAQGLAKSKNLKIVSQNGNEEEINGFWVHDNVANSPIYYGYIPINPSKPVGKLEFVNKDPLRTDDYSRLSELRQDRKIANILKQYVLWEYAQDPEAFSEDSFEIDPDYVYDLSKIGNKFGVNDIVYVSARDRRIIVTSEKVRDGLMYHLKLSLLNDKPGVLAMKDKKSLEGLYQNLSDFRPRAEEVIFSNVTNIIRWKLDFERNQRNNAVMYRFLPEFREPYFYRNIKIKRGKLVIIQNVENGELDRAVAVSDKWKKDRVNIGFSTSVRDDISYQVFTESGLTGTVNRKTAHLVDIVEYENGQYGALLSL